MVHIWMMEHQHQMNQVGRYLERPPLNKPQRLNSTKSSRSFFPQILHYINYVFEITLRQRYRFRDAQLNSQLETAFSTKPIVKFIPKICDFVVNGKSGKIKITPTIRKQ